MVFKIERSNFNLADEGILMRSSKNEGGALCYCLSGIQDRNLMAITWDFAL